MRLVGRELGITFSSGADGATGTVTGRVECVLPERLEERRPARHALWDLPDLALVRVLAPITHACVRLTDRGRPRLDEVAYFGCTEDLGAPEITGRTTRLRGTAGAGAALRLGSDDEIEPGMSGGPVVDLARGEVIGVVKAAGTPEAAESPSPSCSYAPCRWPPPARSGSTAASCRPTTCTTTTST